MASLKVNTNIELVSAAIKAKLEKLRDREYLLRPVAFDVIVMMTERIHGRGQDSGGAQIGTYSNPYLRYRQKHLKRNSDPKIIVSATRQLENDWSVIATPKGYGIGFKNEFNLQKMRWVEQGKGKKIASLSAEESEHVVTRINELTRDALNS